MKILVTGGAGFIGSNLVRFLVSDQGHTVLNLDVLTYAGCLRSLDDLADHPRHQWVRTDICDAAALQRHFAEFTPDWVMHLAAESHVDRSIEAPRAFIDTNIVGTYTLLQAAHAYYDTLTGAARDRFQFLQVSTDEVYGSLGASGAFTEKTSYDPHSPYSASKAAGNHLARAWANTYQLPVLVTHCSYTSRPAPWRATLLQSQRQLRIDSRGDPDGLFAMRGQRACQRTHRGINQLPALPITGQKLE